MFSPSRDQARRFFFESWQKFHARQPLSGLETIALELMQQHPEYHAIFDNPERYVERDYLPESGETNPFLHLGLHLAIREQVPIDQPRGIAAHYRRLLEKMGSTHDAEHLIMDCLAEMIWQAQRNHTAPDAEIYLACLSRC
ncbi:hypothetical protein SCD_n01988 [Sulfuricella denitrificans skB26]|uniref:DUF1841 domain-containing protein n=1 Tax=Sulfuricella denitrificans (strain DSM 22764 / NBRC 105220 / skB26) TaxID=1163617 RepID=S6AM38_SULDS|nr:DUF1841 family protein [Sulfuricella denitrificans]BAN35799.1 hypothetical protein SCD_n01988 [Sulfuricella denitrificans skB26]